MQLGFTDTTILAKVFLYWIRILYWISNYLPVNEFLQVQHTLWPVFTTDQTCITAFSPRAFRKYCNHLNLQGRAGYKPSSPLLFTTNGLFSQAKPSPLVTTNKRWSKAEFHWSQTSWWVILFICIWVTDYTYA